MSSHERLISVVVPVFNEATVLGALNKDLFAVLQNLNDIDFEIIYVDDGSSDNSADLIRSWRTDDPRIKLVKLSRNFGKESALTAGISEARGDAVILIDADGQHPPDVIPTFIEAWRSGAQVVVGVRRGKQSESSLRNASSVLFNRAFSATTSNNVSANTTDFRLIDAEVRDAFLQMDETERTTRGLIDWLGYRRVLVPFDVKLRTDGAPGYTRAKLLRLAANSFVSLTPAPLYFFGYFGVLITLLSGMLGSTIIVEQLILEDPLHWNFTGTAMLGILIIFLVGIVLLSQGILSLYISHIHSQTMHRPLFVIDKAGSAGLHKNKQ